MTTRDYIADTITVHWDSEICIHSGNCARALPTVFRPKERPWVDLSAASGDDVAAAIDLCPSGALRYTRTQTTSDTEESTEARVVITAGANGPLLVKGPIEVRDSAGTVVFSGEKAALCRCGASENKPLCDGSHKRIGFVAP